MAEKKGQFRYGLFAHRGDGRYVWDERFGKIYYRESAAQQAADKMNERGERGGNIVVRSESWTQHYPRRNPGFTAKEERQYKDILASGARRRYGKRAKEVAARTVLKRRRITARGRRRVQRKRSNPGTHTLTVAVKHFQGYATDVAYQREIDGKLYHHAVETDAAELYLCESREFGKCVLIVDPSGKTPLWK